MGMSETVLAAMIGASATFATALFSAARSKAESRSSRNLLRTSLSIVALMAASAVGGYFYAELRADNTRRDLQAMRDEFGAQLKAVASSTARLETLQTTRVQASAMPTVQLAATTTPLQQVESVVHLPACRGSTDASDTPTCDSTTAQRVSLCASIPSDAIIQDVQVFSRSEAASPDWNMHRVGFDQDSDGARFVDKPYEQVVSADRKALCVNYAQSNGDQAHFARLVVQFRSQQTG